MTKADDQLYLFENPKAWEDEWQGMPEFVHEDLKPFQKIVVNFKTRNDVKEFAKAIGQTITAATDTLWFPLQEKYVSLTKRYIDES